MKQRRLLYAALPLLLLFATACGRVSKPEGWAAPVQAGDILLVHTAHDHITALRQGPDGPPAVLWNYPESSSDRRSAQAIYATPIVDGSTVYVVAFNGDVAAIDLEHGRRLPAWPTKVNVGGHVVATPAYDGKTLYVADEAGVVRGIDAASGTLGASLVDADERIWGRPVLAQGGIYIGALDRRVRAFSTGDQHREWERDLGGAIAGDLVVDGNLIFAGTLERKLYALDMASGEVRWSFEGDGWFWARPLVKNGIVYAATVDGTVYALDRDTGKERWRFHEALGEMRGAPALVGDTLVVANRNGDIYGLDIASGAQRWATPRPGSKFLSDPLVLESDVLFVSSSGEVLRVRPRDGGATDLLYKAS